MDYKRAFVHFLIENKCIMRNKNLEDGRICPMYFDFSDGIYSGNNIAELAIYYAHALYESFATDDKTVLFGPAMKGIPLVTETAHTYATLYHQNLRFAFNREREKDGKLLCGTLYAEDKIILLDDVFTKGETKRVMKELLSTAVPRISFSGVLIGIDKKEMDRNGFNTVELFAHETEMPVHAVATIDDVLKVMEEENLLTEEWKEEIRKDRIEHGC